MASLIFFPQDFFERQKLISARSQSGRTTEKTKKGLSQDLVALHTVSRVHSHIPTDVYKRKHIKKVDLEKFHSCTRQIGEVDIGPCSPTQAPSKIILTDKKNDRESHFPHKEADSRSTKDISKPDSISSRYPITDTKQRQKRLDKHSEKHVENISKKTDKLDCEMMTSEKPEGAFLFSKPKAVSDFENGCTGTKLEFDPFASEDFQITPLVGYVKKRSSDHLEEGIKHNKRKHLSETKSKMDQIPGKTKVHKSEQQHFTSTPVKNNFTKCATGHSHESFGDISPIFKGTSFSKDMDIGFKFKPRPMLMTPDAKYTKREQYIFHIQDEKATNVEFDSVNRNAPSRVCIEAEQNPQCSTSSEDLHMYSAMKSSGSQCDRGNLIISSCFKSQLDSFRSGLGSVSSFSRSDTSCDILNNSASGNDLTFKMEPVNTGSLTKFKYNKRHRNDNKYFDLDRNHNVNVDDNREIQKKAEFSKPKFADIEEDFHFKPMKPKVAHSSDIINMYKTFGKEKNVQAGVRTEKMDDDTNGEHGRLSSGSFHDVPSPVPADEFPQHLLSPSEQLKNEMKRTLSQIVTEKMKDGPGSNQTLLDEDSAQFYKPLKYHMDDVLNEMNQLEEQDIVTPDITLDKNNTVVPLIPSGVVTTESFEADAYIETEEMLMNADIESMQKLDENSKDQICSGAHYDRESIDQTNLESITEEVNSILREGTKREGICSLNQIEANTKHVMVESENEQSLPTNRDGEIKNNASKLSQFTKANEQHDMEVIVNSKNGISFSPKKSSDMCGVSANSDTALIKHEVIGLYKDADNCKPCGKNMAYIEDVITDGSQIVGIGKFEADKTAVLKQLQDPEVSSGKNQSTQTEANWCLQKTFVEASTSPMRELIVHKLTDFGIQCDLTPIPTLASLAGYCLSVKPRKTTTLVHKPSEETDHARGLLDHSADILEAPRIPAAQTYIENLAAKCGDTSPQ